MLEDLRPKSRTIGDAIMTKSTPCLVIAVALAGCASYPAPAQRLADAEASSRGAVEVGITASPQAQLHLTMAQEEIARAKRLMSDGDNKAADFMLMRAKGDAELALAFARETQAEDAARQALEQGSAMQNQLPASTTTTTSAPTTKGAPTTTTTTTTTTGGKP
jgi:Domain of unknown function (DUF4398)